MLDITSEDYTPEPAVQSYRSHGPVRVKFLWVMNLRGSCGSCVSAVTRSIGTWRLAFSPERGVPMKDFRNLRVWEKSYLLTLAVYKVSAGFPRQELFGLTSQMRR